MVVMISKCKHLEVVILSFIFGFRVNLITLVSMQYLILIFPHLFMMEGCASKCLLWEIQQTL